MPRTGTRLIHKSLHDALPSPLVCSHPKEQGLNPSPVSYHLGDPEQSDSTFLSLGPWVQNSQIIPQAYQNLTPV